MKKRSMRWHLKPSAWRRRHGARLARRRVSDRAGRLREMLDELGRGALADVRAAVDDVAADLDELAQAELDAIREIAQSGEMSADRVAIRLRWERIKSSARANRIAISNTAAARARVIERLERLGGSALRLLGSLL